MLQFPAAADIIALHEALIRDAPPDVAPVAGILSHGAIGSAIRRAMWGAMFMRGIVQDHPFADGNKRTGFTATRAFLAANGVRLDAPDEDVVEFTLEIARGEHAVETIADWLRDHSAERLSSGEGDS